MIRSPSLPQVSVSFFLIFVLLQLGNTSSCVGGVNLNKGDSASLGPGGMFCLLGDSYRYFIHFTSTSSEKDVPDREPRAKKARCDTLSDSDDDNLSQEDLEDIRREFGHEMVEKIQQNQKQQQEVVKQENSLGFEHCWENIEGKLIIFTSKGIEGRSKVFLTAFKIYCLVKRFYM